MSDLKIAVVLPGGGARAAFQVGALEALANMPVTCAAVSGVGAGALNGLILASSEDLKAAHERLKRLWVNAVMAPQSALQIGSVPVAQLGLYLTLLYAGGADPMLHEILKAAGRGAGQARRVKGAASIGGGKVDAMVQMVELVVDTLNVSTDANLDTVLSTSLGEAALDVRRPFFVSTYRSGAGIVEQLRLVLQGAGVLNPGSPSFLPVHELAGVERLAAVLASASLPFACGPREIGGTVLIDGSYGGLSSSAGAVPVSPMLHLSGIDVIVVIHTDLSSPFDASQFKGPPIFEIKPSASSDDEDVGYFWASASSLGHWIDQGRQDAEQQIHSLLDALARSRSSRDAHAKAHEAGSKLDALD